ncbi:MAG: hypothetical protein AAFZ65_15950, partial [Planctomycetota bacterium]
MERESNGQFGLPIVGIVVAGVVLGGTLLIDKPYESLRPTRPEILTDEPTLGSGPVIARLWQDPLQVVREHTVRSDQKMPTAQGVANPHSVDYLREEILGTLAHPARHAATSLSAAAGTGTAPNASDGAGVPAEEGADRATSPNASSKGVNDAPTRAADAAVTPSTEYTAQPVSPPAVLILPVLVPGTQSAVDDELRIRERHAVVSALGASGFVPHWDQRISYVDTHWLELDGPIGQPSRELVESSADDLAARLHLVETRDLIDAGGPSRLLRIPTEWFERDPDLSQTPATASEHIADVPAGRPDHVLVLWFDATSFGKSVVSGLDKFLTRLLGNSPRLSEALEQGEVEVRVLGPPNSTVLEYLDSAGQDLSRPAAFSFGVQALFRDPRAEKPRERVLQSLEELGAILLEEATAADPTIPQRFAENAFGHCELLMQFDPLPTQRSLLQLFDLEPDLLRG